jgi:intein-encoded DNA endonuclease-like protein
MDLLRRGNFCSNVNPVGTTVKILYLKQNVCYSGIFKHLLFEYSVKFKPNNFVIWWTSVLFKHNMTLERGG